MQFSPDKKLLAIGDEEGFVTLWDVETGTQLKRFVVGQEISGTMNS